MTGLTGADPEISIQAPRKVADGVATHSIKLYWCKGVAG